MFLTTLNDQAAANLADGQRHRERHEEQLADARSLWRWTAADLDHIGNRLAAELPQDELVHYLTALRIARAALAHALHRRGEKKR